MFIILKAVKQSTSFV